MSEHDGKNVFRDLFVVCVNGVREQVWKCACRPSGAVSTFACFGLPEQGYIMQE